jgi:hypothetical protein
VTAGWVTAAVALAVALAGLAGWGLRVAWRLVSRTIRFLDDWAGEPARPGVAERPGVMARLQSVEQSLASVLAETKPNGGSSLRDVVHRTAADVADIKYDQIMMRQRMELFEHNREERGG